MPADKLHITLAGSEHVVEEGTTAGQVLAGRPEMIAARVNGELRDLAAVLGEGDELEPVSIGALAVADHCSQPTMSAGISGLVESGWASKRPNPADARSHLVTLTGDGRRVLRQARRERDPVGVGQPNVEEHQVDWFIARRGSGGGAGLSLGGGANDRRQRHGRCLAAARGGRD